MLLALTEIACTIPFGIFSIYVAARGGQVQPWISWQETHLNFWHVQLIPSVIWRSDSGLKASIEVTRWLYPVCALLFFALFGFADEARKNYGYVICKVGLFGWKPKSARLMFMHVTPW
jgi:pheromone a factor receptor